MKNEENPRTKTEKINYEMDMCHGPILKKMLWFAIPLMLSSMLQMLFSATDLIVVGKFGGDRSLAAVGSNTALINLFTNVFIGLSIGVNVLIAKYYGGKQDEDVEKTVHTAIVLSLLSGLALTLIGELFAQEILILMGTSRDYLDLAQTYLRIYFLGMPAMMLYNFGSSILRAVGDTRRPLFYLMGAGALNAVLNFVFVGGLGLDVAGSGIATVISQSLSAFLMIRCLVKETGVVHVTLKKLKLHKDKVIQIMRIGIPAGLTGTIFSLSNVVIQSAVNSFGATVVAGSSAAANLEGFVYFAMNAFHHATLSFTSQNLGAGQYKRITKILLTGLAAVTVTGFVVGYLVVFFGRTLLGIYTSNPAEIEAGMTRIWLVCGLYALCGMMDVMVGGIRGLGYSVLPMIVSLIGACGLRLLWIATVFQIPQFHTIQTVFVSYPATWSITLAAHMVCYYFIRKQVRKKYQTGVSN